MMLGKDLLTWSNHETGGTGQWVLIFRSWGLGGIGRAAVAGVAAIMLIVAKAKLTTAAVDDMAGLFPMLDEVISHP